MSSPPMPAASLNMSACSVHAVSQVGCRLIVASSAKSRRPRAPCTLEGPSARTRSRNVSISDLDENGAGVCWEFLAMARFYTEIGMRARISTHHVNGGPERECKLADLSDDIVNLEGLIHDGEPFRTGS